MTCRKQVRSGAQENGGPRSGDFRNEGKGALAGVTKYGSGLAALAMGKRLLIVNPGYLLGKHGSDSSSAGSKLGSVDSEDKLTRVLQDHINESTLEGCKGITRLTNVNTGQVVGRDSVVEIISLERNGQEVSVGSKLEEGVRYVAQVKDASGKTFTGTVVYEETRPASDDGKFPAIKQPVVYTEMESPETGLLNMVVLKLDLCDPRAAWVEADALRQSGVNPDNFEGVYTVLTIFPGTYSPPANEPKSSQVDDAVGMTGNEYWAKHALMKKSAEAPKDCNNIDLGKDVKAVRVYKKPVVLSFEYASEDTTIETKEGPVKCAKGDAVLTGTKGERWPIQRQKFESTYDVVGEGQCAKKKIEVLAVQMDEPFTVNVSWSQDPLVGKPQDWLVQYGKGDFGIVSKEIFAETYSRV
jgi:hypothetical protein